MAGASDIFLKGIYIIEELWKILLVKNFFRLVKVILTKCRLVHAKGKL